MSGQPEKFNVVRVLAKEKPAVPGPPNPPATTILVGDKLTLKTYLNVNDIPMANAFVGAALAGGTVTYYFEDLDSGGAPIKKPGGAISPQLSADDVAIALGMKVAAPTNPGVVQDELKQFGLSPAGDWYLSVDTADITTGTVAPADLVVPAPQKSGSWRVLTAVWGGMVFGKPSQVAAHDDDLLIQVTT